MARDRWSREELLAFQRERVRALIRHAAIHSPYYREVLGADAAERPLSELPTLPKSTMMAEFERIVTDPRLRLTDLRTHLGAVEVEPVPALEREPGGKIRLVRSA
jgi:phenylacetate-CoA ligase